MNDFTATAGPRSLRIVIAGLPGSGKTTLATLLLKHLEEPDDHDARFELNAEGFRVVEAASFAIQSGDWPASNRERLLRVDGLVRDPAGVICPFELVEFDATEELAPPHGNADDIVLKVIDLADFLGASAPQRLEREIEWRRLIQQASSDRVRSILTFTKIGLYADLSSDAEEHWAALWAELPVTIRQQMQDAGFFAVDAAPPTRIVVDRSRKPVRLPAPGAMPVGFDELRSWIMGYVADMRQTALAEAAVPPDVAIATDAPWQRFLTRRLLPAILSGVLFTLFSRGCGQQLEQQGPNPIVVSTEHFDQPGFLKDGVRGVCRVKNSGMTGNVTITVTLIVNERPLETQRRQLFMNAGESCEVTFEFIRLTDTRAPHRLIAEAGPS